MGRHQHDIDELGRIFRDLAGQTTLSLERALLDLACKLSNRR
jgi:hypothetical protein